MYIRPLNFIMLYHVSSFFHGLKPHFPMFIMDFCWTNLQHSNPGDPMPMAFLVHRRNSAVPRALVKNLLGFSAKKNRPAKLRYLYHAMLLAVDVFFCEFVICVFPILLFWSCLFDAPMRSKRSLAMEYPSKVWLHRKTRVSSWGNPTIWVLNGDVTNKTSQN